MKTIVERLTRFVQRVFKTTLDIFLEALKLSPNAQGYVSGSITELLLKNKMEKEYGFEVKRIREKWEGKKKHHGDFYFRRLAANKWYVLESKGVKSNSEKWHKLYNHDNLRSFLIAHADSFPSNKRYRDVAMQVDVWIEANLPKFKSDYLTPLYEYEEVKKYLRNKPKRDTEKSRAIDMLGGLSRDQISSLIAERLEYLMSKVKVLETHFVSGTSSSSERTQATPRKDEFHVVSVDIALRYPEHKFLFANPKQLESSGDDPNHLQQNYIMGFVFVGDDGTYALSLTDEWYENFMDVFESLDPDEAVDEKDMQIDNRYVITEED